MKGIAQPIQVFLGANRLTIGHKPGDDAHAGTPTYNSPAASTPERVDLSELAEIFRPAALFGELAADILERTDPFRAPVAVEVCAGQLGDRRTSIDVPTGDGASLFVAVGQHRRRCNRRDRSPGRGNNEFPRRRTTRG